MKQFETGKRYFCRSIGDYGCIHTMRVISRTNKTIKVKMQNWIDVKTLRVSVYEGIEQVKPLGTYSMCPVITAEKVFEDRPCLNCGTRFFRKESNQNCCSTDCHLAFNG